MPLIIYDFDSYFPHCSVFGLGSCPPQRNKRKAPAQYSPVKRMTYLGDNISISFLNKVIHISFCLFFNPSFGFAPKGANLYKLLYAILSYQPETVVFVVNDGFPYTLI